MRPDTLRASPALGPYTQGDRLHAQPPALGPYTQGDRLHAQPPTPMPYFLPEPPAVGPYTQGDRLPARPKSWYDGPNYPPPVPAQPPAYPAMGPYQQGPSTLESGATQQLLQRLFGGDLPQVMQAIGLANANRQRPMNVRRQQYRTS